MEKRKDAAGYQHQCFTMMVLLNVIIVLFLTFTIVLTQYRRLRKHKNLLERLR